MQTEELINYRLPRYSELPEIELYMDQLLSYLKLHMLDGEREVITNTMINNYVKHGIVKAPVKKKYKKYHIAYLLAVLFLKKVYSLDEINKLVNIQINSTDIVEAYDTFCDELEADIKSLVNKDETVKGKFEVTGGDTNNLFRATILSVATRVYVETCLRQ